MKYILSILIILLPATAFCQEPGTLDQSFGTKGMFELQPGQKTTVYDIALQPDDKIVFTGVVNGMLLVGRLNTDGSLDHSFAQKGFDTIEIENFSVGSAIGVLPDGKIVAAGECDFYGNGSTNGMDFLVTRFNQDGSLDHSFGGDGIVTTEIRDWSNDYCNDMVLQPDGKILLAGESGALLAFARYNTDGSLDPTFNDSGKREYGLPNSTRTVANAIVLQPDGYILVGGVVDPPAMTGNDFALLRFKPDGQLDSSFATNGLAIVDFNGGFDRGFDLVVLPDGKIIIAGSAEGYGFVMIKFNPDGSIDNSFGDNGTALHDLGSDDGCHKIVVQNDGRILLSGGSTMQFVVARFYADGSLDKTFGVNGVVKTDFGSTNEAVYGMVLQPDGKIVVAGFADYPNQQRKAAFARYNGRWASNISSDIRQESISIYPVPADKVLYIQNHTQDNIHWVQVLNPVGILVKDIPGKNIQAVDLRDIPTGAYFIHLYIGTDHYVKSFLISR